MSIRIVSVSGPYLNCIWELILNDHHNGICIWSVTELYLEEALNEYHNGIRVWGVYELYLKVESE